MPDETHKEGIGRLLATILIRIKRAKRVTPARGAPREASPEAPPEVQEESAATAAAAAAAAAVAAATSTVAFSSRRTRASSTSIVVLVAASSRSSRRVSLLIRIIRVVHLAHVILGYLGMADDRLRVVLADDALAAPLHLCSVMRGRQETGTYRMPK